MCLEMYVGCPSCGAAADSGDVHQASCQYEYIHVALHADGTPNYDVEPVFADGESEDRGYSCDCGWAGADLDTDLSRDECECAECDPPSFMDGGDEPDEDAAITLVGEGVDHCADLPFELQRMQQDRALWYVVVPRWRAYELDANFLGVSAEYQPDRELSQEARVLTYPPFNDREVISA